MSTQLKNKDEMKHVLKKRKYRILSPQVKNKLCKIVEETGDWKTACARLNVSQVNFQNALKKDITLAERLQIAEGRYLDELETEARRRAVSGVEKGIWFQGQKVGTETEYSDRLLEKLMSAADKEKYSKETRIKSESTVTVTSEGVRKKLSSMLDLDLGSDEKTLEEEAIEGEYEEDNRGE